MVPFGEGTFYDKVNDTIYSNDGTGTLVTKRIPALADGSGLDARDGLPITNPGGYANNDFGGTVIQTDFGIVDSMDDGTAALTFTTVTNSRPEYQRDGGSVNLYWDGVDRWIWNNNGDTYYNLSLIHI